MSIEKRAAVERSIFRTFASTVLKSIEEDDGGPIFAAGLLNGDKTGPAKDDRPPRSSYARQEASRSLVDHVIGKSAT